MIRFIRALIYGAVAAIAATFVLDWLDRNANTPANPGRVEDGRSSRETIDKLGDDAKQALLDELASQV